MKREYTKTCWWCRKGFDESTKAIWCEHSDADKIRLVRLCSWDCAHNSAEYRGAKPGEVNLTMEASNEQS